MGPGLPPPTTTTTGFPDDSPDFSQRVTLHGHAKQLEGDILLWKVAITMGREESAGFVAVQAIGSPNYVAAARRLFEEHFEVLGDRDLPILQVAVQVRNPEHTFFLRSRVDHCFESQQLLDAAIEVVMRAARSETEGTESPPAQGQERILFYSRPAGIGGRGGRNPSPSLGDRTELGVDQFVDQALAELRRVMGIEKFPPAVIAALFRVGAEQTPTPRGGMPSGGEIASLLHIREGIDAVKNLSGAHPASDFAYAQLLIALERHQRELKSRPE